MTLFDSIANVNDYLSEHWLAEVFPAKLKELSATWKELAGKGKETPVRGLATLNGSYLTALASLPDRSDQEFVGLVTQTHQILLRAVGFDATPVTLETGQAETPINVPLLGRFSSTTSDDALHILQAVPVESVDAMLGDDAHLLVPITLNVTADKTETLTAVSKAITQLFVSDDPPRYLLVVAGSAVLVTDAARWSEGRYLAFDISTALDRRDDKTAGELAFHAGLWSADVLLPNDDGKTTLDTFTEDSEKHAVGVSEDLREGLRISIEKIANEVLDQRRANDQPVEGIPELPRDLTTQSLRFLYRILFLLFAEARPELGILPVGAPEYGSGYGLDRLREIIQVPLTGASASGHHLHDSLNLLFRLVNEGHNFEHPDGDGLVFEPLRSDLFDRDRTPLIDEATLSNRVLQDVLTLLLLSKPSKNKNRQRGYISYAQLGINQLGAVYEGLMSYSGLIAQDDTVEVAKDGNADKGSWLVPSIKSGEYDEKDLVWREDRLTGRKDIVRHPKGSFVFRLSGRDRQRSASYYTPEVLTKTVVKHALAELISDDTRAEEILEYRICEPALGSGAFLNEAINQLAAEYLARRQDELGRRIDPEEYAAELQKVKAYIALHRAYGVDLNSTAVELAEVSLWLNVMHRGLRAPWFGLHLRRGNSLIGARRATYDFTALGRAKKSWLKTPPTDRKLSDGAIGDGEIHHFLLPADGWGSVADASQANELAPNRTAALKKWRAAVNKKPTPKQIERLRALARRVERLWELSLRRMEISEREIARQIQVWGADIRPIEAAVTREAVESELLDPEGPYMRLRLAMNAWCSLWFWPCDEKVPQPPTLDEWIETLEGLLGAAGLAKSAVGQGMFHETVERFDQLSQIDELERQFAGMRPVWQLVAAVDWLGAASAIADRQGFFHWELDFADVFSTGGFDLQVGNPPWVRPSWRDTDALAEFDPFFLLQEKIPEKIFNTRRQAVLSASTASSAYLDEVSEWSGTVASLSSHISYGLLFGVQTNLYTNFMVRSWRNCSASGVIGLIHPEGHFTDPKAGMLRAATYTRLRRHWQFLNGMFLFEEINDKTVFGVHVYGHPRAPSFLQMSYLQSPTTVDGSLKPGGFEDEPPGIQYAWGGWDIRPHSSRVTLINLEVLKDWAQLFDPPGTPAGQARLLRPITNEHIEILRVFSSQPTRMADVGFWWSRLWDEKGAKSDGTIEWDTRTVEMQRDIILQGPHFSVANPYARQPNEGCKNNQDYAILNLEEIPNSFMPRTNYQRACEVSTYEARLPRWAGRTATDYWRVAWRNMTQPGLERSLHAAIIPPGPAHVHTVYSLAISPTNSGTPSGPVDTNDGQNLLHTALVAGLWASLPFDYLIKVSGATKVNAEMIERFPVLFSNPACLQLLLRVLRLNCLTNEYAALWEMLYDDRFAADSWTAAFPGHPDGLGVSERRWTSGSAIRSDLERRSALVEIDALVALMLGLKVDQLLLIYRAQFPVLRRYEFEMYFDSEGRRIAKDHHAYGVGQSKEDYKLLQAFLSDADFGDLLTRYKPFAADDNHDQPWFYKADRAAEMRDAYSEFDTRFAQA
ncbi:restriction endonuclease subunit M [Candidatus Mycobacterium wuenschmannii]|uniref:site-specific DNA-methyltransferase (adenine-specific) n=1 Tax=Candidatus Mycobacterium wuenschmannii TaxID=3027808 RepID=A0ABY8VVU8_9MYCO|nr:restriction endonuclease subunit M [Candidatus Mycobacterium wuenschmannii]WIM87436.1 restriction endonuclease subunit M [Candidatus Mycobacterium wuenschmannii]